jgi:hypothetical protein
MKSFKRVFLILAWPMALILLCFLLCKCEKEEPIINISDCVECKKTNNPTIDTCGSTQDLFTYCLELKKQGYICKATNNK